MKSERKRELWSRIISNIRVDFECQYEGTLCWLWNGSDSGTGRGGGYGRISIDGHTAAVHRVVYTLVHGWISPKRHVDHKCRNRLCCNPDHLEDMTARKNQRKRAEAAVSMVDSTD